MLIPFIVGFSVVKFGQILIVITVVFLFIVSVNGDKLFIASLDNVNSCLLGIRLNIFQEYMLIACMFCFSFCLIWSKITI